MLTNLIRPTIGARNGRSSRQRSPSLREVFNGLQYVVLQYVVKRDAPGRWMYKDLPERAVTSMIRFSLLRFMCPLSSQLLRLIPLFCGYQAFRIIKRLSCFLIPLSSCKKKPHISGNVIACHPLALRVHEP